MIYPHPALVCPAAHAAALEFYRNTFGVKRAVLPRVLTVEQIERLTAETPLETEAFVYGGLCPMAEGRCARGCGVIPPAITAAPIPCRAFRKEWR
jgi:collagenase-like PrtC family protease